MTSAVIPHKTATAPARLPVPLPLPSTAPAKAAHPHAVLDRASRAVLARLTGGVSPFSIQSVWQGWALNLARSPGRQLELVERAQVNAGKVGTLVLSQALGREAEAPFRPRPYDHRFAHASWDMPLFALWKQAFLATQDWWEAATDNMPGLRPQDADRVQFQVRQALDLVSPSNFPWLNPEIMEETARTGGRNLMEGTALLTQDLIQTLLQTKRPAPEGFRIGIDLACTPGEVIFRNEMFELIQYAPQTKTVRPEPILFVPAWIMKYYILDLSQQNSMVRYFVRQGFTVFMISWRNPGPEHADWSLEDYRTNGIMAALDVIGAVVPDVKIHANGYCLGGTLLAIAAATMARDGDDRLATITLMAAQVDFAEAGELLLFVDENQVAFVEDFMWDQGYLDRPQMTRTFASIRAEDLIYTRAVNRYFLGKPDLPTDLGVWNGDTTRMPARMHSEYLRGLFLENRLTAGRFAVNGRVIALKDITTPMFVVGTETDHIAPWRSVYKMRLFSDCDLTFALTSSGHNGGILSEPGHIGRHYRIGRRAHGDLYQDPDTWFEKHDSIEGSWWEELSDWLLAASGPAVPATSRPAVRRSPDSATNAPGRYVFD